MRAAVLFNLAMFSLVLPRPAAAQDDFDEEFEEEEEPPPASDSEDESEGDEFDDEGFDDEGFDDEEFEEEPPPDEQESSDDEFGDDEFADDEAASETDDEFADEAGQETEDPDEETPEDRRFRLHNSLSGSVGGLHVVDAGSGSPDSFRVQLMSDFFFANDFLETGDEHRHIGGSLSLSWTPTDFIEAFMSVSSYANSNTAGDPELFQVLGDALLGVKGFYSITPWLTVGGDLTLALLNTVGDIGLVFKSTSVGFRGNLAADLRELDNSIPLIARFNFQYYLDNSYNLVEDVETQRYQNLENAATPMTDERRHLLTRIERFGLNINRTDFFNIGIGFEAPLRVVGDFYVHPLLEWTWSIPINRRGFSCLFVPSEDDPSVPADGDDACLDTEGAAAFPMDLTLGVRVLPPVEGLAILAAADIGLTGKSNPVRELAGNNPYAIYFALSYAYDTDPEPDVIIREVTRDVEVPAPPPLRGRVHGYVIEHGAGTPVAGARVDFPALGLTSLVTGADGTFTSYPLEPGEVQLALSHPDYDPGACVVTIPDERPEEGELLVEVRCEIVAHPRVGVVRGLVTSPDGNPIIAAQVQFNGPTSRSIGTDAMGNYVISDLQAGTYLVSAIADGYLTSVQRLTLAPNQTAQLDVVVARRPRNPSVELRGRTIAVRRSIGFVRNSDEIEPRTVGVLIELADLLMTHPEITTVEIQGHTDNTGSTADQEARSLRRADSVRNWLVDHGIEAHRLVTRGYGGSRPIAPNITAGNRARNNRIQFVLPE